MIFYFSGTGNSAWVARQIAKAQQEELLAIAEEINKNKEYNNKINSEIKSKELNSEVNCG